jgi:ubiquinone biosynthesis accessory factor UbiJ
MPLLDASLEILEAAVNRYLSLDDGALDHLAKLHGKVVEFRIDGPDISLYFIPSPAGLQVFAQIEGEPDCTIQGTLFALAKLGSSEKNDQLFGGDVRISGDAALAHQFGRILSAIDIDWEEQLSRIVGDIPAHQFGHSLRGLFSWGASAQESIEQDIAEYLQEEIRSLPHPEECREFDDGVDRTRDDVERLEARVKRMQHSIGEANS